MLSLFVLPRKGLYQLTLCKNCGHIFECPNCDAKLITYRGTNQILELFCNQCQTYFEYPNQCPKCASSNIISKYGAIEQLVENLIFLGRKVYRFDQAKNVKKIQSPKEIYQKKEITDFVTTRLFDPSIKYDEFDRIVFVNAENLLANPDYLVHEDTTKSLGEVFLRVSPETEIIFDAPNEEVPMIKEILKLGHSHLQNQTIFEWYYHFLQKESQLRQKFGLPPYKNVLLLTTQEKNRQNALQKLIQLRIELKKYLNQLPDIEISNPYPARFFRRKNMYSYHLLVKYPRQYPDFPKLREIIIDLSQTYQIQVRLNPRHLF